MILPGIIEGAKQIRTQVSTPPGVTFAGSIQSLGPTYLHNASLLCIPDNGAFSFSFWAQNLQQLYNAGCTLFVTDPVNQYANAIQTSGPGGGITLFQVTILNKGGNNFNCTYLPAFSPSDTAWHHYLGSFYTNLPQGEKIGVVYIDDTFITPTISDTGSGFAAPTAGLPCYFGDDLISLVDFPTFPGLGPTCSAADVWIAPNYSILDTVNNVPQSSISEDKRRHFTSIINGELQPNTLQDFHTASIMFTGNAGTFGSNFGFGLSFGLVGALGDASTGPGGIPV